MSPSPPPPCPPPNLSVWTSLAMNSNFGWAPPPAHQGIFSTLKSHPTIAPQLPPRPKGVSPLNLNLKPVSDSKLICKNLSSCDQVTLKKESVLLL